MKIYLQYGDRLVSAAGPGLFEHLPKIGGTVNVGGGERRVLDVIHHMEDHPRDPDLTRFSHIIIRLGYVR